MTERRVRTLESPHGRGKVYKGDDYLADVLYSLTVTQKYVIIQSGSGTQERPGMRDVCGEIRVISGERDLVVAYSGTFELCLEDGRTWSFFAKRGDPVSGSYTASGAGQGIVAAQG